MARGAPDDSNVVKQGAVYRLDDMAELAARLGSIYTYHRFGDVFLQEDFEKGVAKWVITKCGTGSYGSISGDRSLSGNQSFLAHMGAGHNSYVDIMKSLAPVPLGSVGFCFAFSLGSQFGKMLVCFTVYTGTRTLWGETDYYHDPGKISIWIDGPTEEDFILTGPLANTGKMFHILKIGLDTARQKYNYIYLDNQTYTPVDKSLVSWADSTAPRIDINIRCFGVDGDTADCYLDDIVLTQNEF